MSQQTPLKLCLQSEQIHFPLPLMYWFMEVVFIIKKLCINICLKYILCVYAHMFSGFLCPVKLCDLPFPLRPPFSTKSCRQSGDLKISSYNETFQKKESYVSIIQFSNLTHYIYANQVALLTPLKCTLRVQEDILNS